MDSPPECVLAVSCEPPHSPPTLPSLDHSPLGLQLHSPLGLPLHSPSDATPYFPLSPFPGDISTQDNDDDDEGGVPASPTPAVALFPGGGGAQEGPERRPPTVPLLGFSALERALSSGQGGGGGSSDELDLQLFRKDSAVAGATPGVGPSLLVPPGPGVAALKFPCYVCGKLFRFQSILSLHERGHSLERDRRAIALYRAAGAGLPSSGPAPSALTRLTHREPLQNHRGPPQRLLRHLTEEEAQGGERETHPDPQPSFPPDDEGPAPLTPPLTEAGPTAPSSSPYSSSSSSSSPISTQPPPLLLLPPPTATATPVAAAAAPPAFRCHGCKGKFRTASELARHVRILHSPYRCALCPFSAAHEDRLAAHLRECHPSPSPVTTPPATPTAATPPPPATASATTPPLPAFRCDTCGQRFTQSWFLKGHMRKHKDSLDHKCQVCGRGFKEPWFLKNHMKVHLNKLGLKAGLGALGGALGGLGGLGGALGGDQQQQAKGSLNALYSSLLLAQRGGGGGRGGRGRSERDARGSASSSKSAILGYLGLPSDGGGASCMERLQAVAQVAEMGNGSLGAGARGGGETAALSDGGGDQAAMWQLVARSLVAAQQAQHRPPGHGQARGPPGGLEPREEPGSGAVGAGGGPWECPDCGKLFRSLQQVVVHARVHTQRHHKGGAGEAEDGGGGGGGGGARRAGAGRGGDVRQEAKLRTGGAQQPSGFHSIVSTFQGGNGLAPASPPPPLTPSRERVRGSGAKDCPYCGKAFRSSHHLKVHLRVHTGERPYKCPHCDYAGTQSGSLKYHLQRHHREQRNALSASSTTSSTSSTSSSSSATTHSSKQAQHRRSQAPSHGPASAAPPRRPWLLGGPADSPHSHQQNQQQQKALAALRDVDLETQYRYLSGVMGALYQGGLGSGWIRESPPPPPPPIASPPTAPAAANSPSRAPPKKVSRRKPLKTSRMPPWPGAPPSVFEPLDLSHRPSPGPEDVDGEGAGGGGEEGGVTLSQCLFCPFRTSSAELMAMHLQVNHTSKSRRKRRAPASAAAVVVVALGDGPQQPQQPPPAVARNVRRRRAANQDPPASRWRYVGEGQEEEQQQVALVVPEEWGSREGGHALNGLHLRHLTSVAALKPARGMVAEEEEEEEEELEEEEEEMEEEEEGLENGSVGGDSSGQEQGVMVLLPESPADHLARGQEAFLTD